MIQIAIVQDLLAGEFLSHLPQRSANVIPTRVLFSLKPFSKYSNKCTLCHINFTFGVCLDYLHRVNINTQFQS